MNEFVYVIQSNSISMDTSASMLCLVLALSSILFYIALTFRRRASNLPPGPHPLPLIGNLHQLGDKPHKSLSKLAESYGPLMRLKLGQATTIIISNASVAKQVLQKQDQDFANRFVPDSLTCTDHGKLSVAWIPLNARWRELRRISVTHVFSNQKMQEFEHIRQQKVHQLITELKQSSIRGEAVAIAEVMFKTTLNVLSSILVSCDLGAGESSAVGREFKDNFVIIMELAGKPNLVDYFPWLKRFDPQRIRSRITPPLSKIISITDSMIGERLRQRTENGSVLENRDVLDSLINIMQKGEITRDEISHLLLDLFVAGTDTTSSTIEWTIFELINQPDTMRKAKAELDEAIGKGKQIEEGDIPRLPYLQAILKETLRLHPIVPLLLPRKTIKDQVLCGYTIPKDSQIMVNAWAIGRDASIWDCPDSFKPERFLESDVDFKGGHFELIPFGGGRRICAGLPLANKIIHSALGSLINCFDWKLEGGVTPEEGLNMEDEFGLSLHLAQPLRVIPVAI